ncbi:unnamed protein product [Linum trigynum]|uniref:Apple domain-containing protein n=1 Tax=Linum trigynum TaxID=586398 RepID=A0AAV2DJ98_9ROSI
MDKLAMINSTPTRSHSPPAHHLLSLFFSIATLFASLASGQTDLRSGFQATPDQSISSFQPILKDPTGNFSLGFLRVNSSQLALSVLHLPSLQPIWQANPTPPSPSWSDRTRLSFSGRLVLSDSRRGVIWSTTGTDPTDTVVLLNNSNLQVKRNDPVSAREVVVWQSFDFPGNTLVEGQNFSSSATALVAAGGRYAMRLGDDFMAMYADFDGSGVPDRIYWKHKALEARADVVPGRGPIRLRVEPEGFLGMYQNGSGTTPVDVQSFNSFRRRVGGGFYIVRIEPDGNLKGYNWDGASWVLEYQAVPDGCGLPDPCGSYGLCRPGGPTCSCLDETDETRSSRPTGGQCLPAPRGNFCGQRDGFRVLRRFGVDLPFNKELTDYVMTPSLGECEGSCERNCTCWGAVYNNASGFCYLVDYPIQTMLGVTDQSKFGYFKIRNDEDGSKAGKKKNMGSGAWVGLMFLCLSILVLGGAVGFVGFRAWKKNLRVRNRILEEDEGVSAPGPYKDLGSDSFRSVEMGERR